MTHLDACLDVDVLQDGVLCVLEYPGLLVVGVCWFSQKYEKYGTLPKVAAPYSTVKHVSFLDELLCRIWSFEVKRCGYWER